MARLWAERKERSASVTSPACNSSTPRSFHSTGLSGWVWAARRMIFRARSRLEALAASQAWSASLRARRRSFSFCFFWFMVFLSLDARRIDASDGEARASGCSDEDGARQSPRAGRKSPPLADPLEMGGEARFN